MYLIQRFFPKGFKLCKRIIWLKKKAKKINNSYQNPRVFKECNWQMLQKHLGNNPQEKKNANLNSVNLYHDLKKKKQVYSLDKFNSKEFYNILIFGN